MSLRIEMASLLLSFQTSWKAAIFNICTRPCPLVGKISFVGANLIRLANGLDSFASNLIAMASNLTAT